MSDGTRVLSKLLDVGSIGAFRDLDRDCFTEDETEVFDFIRGYVRDYAQLPTRVTAQNEVRVDLDEENDSYDYLLDRVEDRFLFNTIQPLFGQAREQLSNREVRAAIETMREASTAINRVTRATPVVEMPALSHTLRQAMERGRVEGQDPGITTGYAEFDERTLGHQNGDLNFIVARMGVGKTMLLLKNADAARQEGANVMIVSMEMTAPQLAMRLAFLNTGINTKYMRNFRMSSHNLRRYYAFLEQMETWNNFRIFNGNMAGTVEEVESLMFEYRPDILFVDGAYLLKSSYESRYNVDRNQNVAYVADGLKRLAAVADRPVVATTQFNRQAGKGGRQGSLETLGFTDAIAQHSSIVSALVVSNNGPDRRVIRQMKAREGGEGNLEIWYKFKPKNFDAIGWVADDDEEGSSRRGNNPNTQPVSTEYMR